jgi:hypothetical protein
MTDIAVPTTAVTPASPPVKRLLTLDLGADNNLLTGFGTGDALPTPTTGLSPDTAAISPSNSPKRDYSSASYRESLATALRWDPQRQELYLQLPSYPELRLTPFREGIEDDLVS